MSKVKWAVPVRERRLTAIPQDELPLGDDAIELVTDVPADVPAELPAHDPVEAFLDDSPASDDPELRHEAADAAAEEPDPEPVPEEPSGRRTVQKKKGRASVPSWDEIMFGPGSD
jgi:hypothetical protein